MAITPPTNTLEAIQIKVRRLTRSPSTTQLSDNDLNNYINTFVVYDFPEQLRMFNLRTTFTFICNPFQDEYFTDTASFAGATTNQLYNFQNNYISIADPVYIAGYHSFYTQSREQFFAIYPKINFISSIGPTGNGITQTFTGTINFQQAIISNQLNQQSSILLKNQVLFSSIGTNGIGVALQDMPVVDPTTGFQSLFGNLYDPSNLPTSPPTVVDPTNNINYFNGNFTITFSAPPEAGVTINSQVVPQVVSIPQSLMYYDNRFTLRPVPDQPYRIQFEAYKRPTALLQENQAPQLEEWWQYIAYGAARKILQDRMDLESVQMIEPEFKVQERLCLRRTIVQYTNERTATIYTESLTGNGSGGFGGFGGFGLF